MKILFVNACPRGPVSRTLRLAETFLDAVTKAVPDAVIFRHDLPAMRLPCYDEELLARRERLCDQEAWDDPLLSVGADFHDADAVVIAAPYWDLSFPSVLKVWVEHIWVRGLTFRYEADKPIGLCQGRESVYITTSGSPIGENDWGTLYMKAVLTTLGIPGFTRISAEALDLDTTDAAAVMAETIEEIKTEAGRFAERMIK